MKRYAIKVVSILLTLALAISICATTVLACQIVIAPDIDINVSDSFYKETVNNREDMFNIKDSFNKFKDSFNNKDSFNIFDSFKINGGKKTDDCKQPATPTDVGSGTDAGSAQAQKGLGVFENLIASIRNMFSKLRGFLFGWLPCNK